MAYYADNILIAGIKPFAGVELPLPRKRNLMGSHNAMRAFEATQVFVFLNEDPFALRFQRG